MVLGQKVNLAGVFKPVLRCGTIKFFIASVFFQVLKKLYVSKLRYFV